MKQLWHLMKKLNPSLFRGLLSSGILLVLCAFLELSRSVFLVLPACIALDFLFTLLAPKLGFFKLFSLVLASVFLFALLVLRMFRESSWSALIFPSLLVFLLCVCAVYLLQNSFFFRLLLLLLLLGVLIGSSFYKIELPKSVVWLILVSILLFAAQGIEHYLFRSKEQNVLFLFPFLILLSLILPALPVKETPIRWEKIKTLFRYVEEQCTALLVNVNFLSSDSRDTFSFKTSGFSNENTLSGSFFSNPSLQLVVNGSKTHTPLYLAGSIYSSYNGAGWDHTAAVKPYSEPEYLLQNMQLTQAMERDFSLSEETWRYLKPHTYTVTYKGLKTKSIFYPPFTSRLALETKGELLETPYDTPLLKKARGVGFSYRVSFLEPDLAHPGFQALLRKDSGTLSEMPPGENEIDFQERQRYFQEEYTRLPSLLPDRVRLLSEEITAGAANDYDRLLAIRDYLQAFPYSEDPGVLPESRDFVDYFLFDQQTGYCTYYATSMAVMARCLDIPTRYVEGFLVPASVNYHQRDLYVYGTNAHAWVEAYLDGVGWIPFEPTPGYSQALTSWSEAENGSTLAPPSLPQSNDFATQQPQPSQEEQIKDKGLTWQTLSRSFITLLGFLVRFLLILIPFLGIGSAFLLIRMLLRRRQYLLMSPNEKASFLMKQAILLAGRYGFALEEGETLSVFCERTGSLLDTPGISFASLCEQYAAVRFGSASVTQDFLSAFETWLKDRKRQLRRSAGLIRGFFLGTF